jgi:hypothetical protein
MDVDAPDLREALVRAAEAFPAEAQATADLIEIRRQVGPEDRVYVPG